MAGADPRTALPPARLRKMLTEALALLRAGKPAKAGEICDSILAFDPNQPDALHMGGAVALQTGRPDRAIDRLGRLVRLQPQNASALGDLGLALLNAGRLGEAEAALVTALKLKPGFPEAWLNLGNTLLAAGKEAQAAECYGRALQGRPDFAEARGNLAVAHLRMHRPLEALQHARSALKLKPGLFEAARTEALALDVLGRPDEALAAAEATVRRYPKAAAAHYDLGNITLHYGRLAEAIGHIRAAIALAPRHCESYRMLAEIVRHRPGDPDIAAMQQLYDDPALPDAERMHLAFGLGKALGDAGEFDHSFDYVLVANRLRRQQFSYASAESDATFADVKAAFTPALFSARAGSGDPDPTPIFVLGMPRSGTSLVEQVIASHPEVHGSGESSLLNQLVGQLDPGHDPVRLAGIIGSLGTDELRQMGRRYVGEQRALAPDARFIVDKMPGNFLLVGMIRLILPNATIIHCRRDPVDTCLSIFRTHFGSAGLRYAYDLGELGHYYALYADLMAYWHNLLPGFVHDVSYEALVADFDAEAPRLLAACGLDWPAAANRFYDTTRPVLTASAAQVRRPIYKTSVGQAARYGDRITPLLAALDKGGSHTPAGQ